MSSPADVRCLLRALQRSKGPERRRIARHLLDAVGSARASRLDRMAFDEIAAGLRGIGRKIDTLWEPAPLAVGETYLLVTAAGRGDVARLRCTSPAPNATAADFATGALSHVYTARQGLISALGQRSCGLPEGEHGCTPELATRSWSGPEGVDGASLGLSVAIATMSFWLGRAPRSDVAGTARLHADGTLSKVCGLPEKIAALRSRWPNVRVLVVSADQDGIDDAQGLEIVRPARLADAVLAFGLDFDRGRLPLRDGDRLATRLEGFRRLDNQSSHSQEGWLDLAAEAEYIAQQLAQLGRPTLAASALGWSSLFLLHAGQHDAASRMFERATPEQVAEMEPACRVWFRIQIASARIDGAQASASESAESAFQEADALPVESRRELFGRALGTHGRALMHAAQPAAALPLLVRAADFHREHLPAEEPRSRSYQAICLRLLGRHADALEVAIAAREAAVREPSTLAATSSLPFLRLEQGRALLALARPAEALECFRLVGDPQSSGSNYPALAGVRGLAASLRRLGRHSEAQDALSACIAVALQPSLKLIAAVAAYAVGDALLDLHEGLPVARSSDELWRIWRAHYPQDATIDDVSARLALAVY